MRSGTDASGGGHGLLDPDALGRVLGFHRGKLALKAGHEFQPFQPDLVLPLQHIHASTGTIRVRTISASGSQLSVLKEQRIQGSNRGTNTLHRCP
ncbi:hypothetical protein [Arthrobacter sp. MAHUQ-56]